MPCAAAIIAKYFVSPTAPDRARPSKIISSQSPTPLVAQSTPIAPKPAPATKGIAPASPKSVAHIAVRHEPKTLPHDLNAVPDSLGELILNLKPIYSPHKFYNLVSKTRGLC